MQRIRKTIQQTTQTNQRCNISTRRSNTRHKIKINQPSASLSANVRLSESVWRCSPSPGLHRAERAAAPTQTSMHGFGRSASTTHMTKTHLECKYTANRMDQRSTYMHIYMHIYIYTYTYIYIYIYISSHGEHNNKKQNRQKYLARHRSYGQVDF